MPDYEFEKAAVNSGFSCICGVDEAGGEARWRVPFARRR